jgi:hypothetical protein
MKNKLSFFIGALMALAIGMAYAFDKPEMPQTLDMEVYKTDNGAEVVDYAASVKPYWHRPYSLDTITNAANDTILLPVALYSAFEGVFQVVRTSISGTANIALKVEQSNIASGNTDWVSVATGSGTGATTEALQLTSMNGLRYRLILDGTGTQSTSYRAHVTIKRKY